MSVFLLWIEGRLSIYKIISKRCPVSGLFYGYEHMDINNIKFKALFQDVASLQNIWRFSTVNTRDVDFLNFRQRSEWLQFTGLHDKDGHEIFEGDLLQWANYIVEVVFEAGSFKVLNDGNADMLLWYCLPECKVIGNKYEKRTKS